VLNEEVRVLDHGFVRLDAVMADDLSVVNGARVSLGKRSELVHSGEGPGGYYSLKDDDAGLIKFLMRERHGTPFEHNAFRFHVKAPLMVFREWQRHRISSYNELSGRYVKFENPDFYLPNEFRQRKAGSKVGAYEFEKWKGNTKQSQALMMRHYQDCLDLYSHFTDHDMATEQARLVLPLALYSEMYWTANARSIMNFLSLRNEPQAQWEIRQYAMVVEELVGEQMPATIEAFRNNDRVAP
jgi:thymidylate synthase (FAD)